MTTSTSTSSWGSKISPGNLRDPNFWTVTLLYPCIYGILVDVAVKIFALLALRLTNFENHRTQTTFMNRLILKVRYSDLFLFCISITWWTRTLSFILFFCLSICFSLPLIRSRSLTLSFSHYSLIFSTSKSHSVPFSHSLSLPHMYHRYSPFDSSQYSPPSTTTPSSLRTMRVRTYVFPVQFSV